MIIRVDLDLMCKGPNSKTTLRHHQQSYRTVDLDLPVHCALSLHFSITGADMCQKSGMP